MSAQLYHGTKQCWSRTWVNPLHAVWVCIIVTDAEAVISNDAAAVISRDGAIRVEVIASPARVCDDCVR